MRNLKYVEAINETLYQFMEEDERIVILGACSVSSPWYVGGTLEHIKEIFPKRVIDGPVSENAITGMAIGMAIMGMRPILVFPRMDFMLYAMDPIINQAAKWSYMFGGKMSVPLVIWAIINRGGSQGAQHSQDFSGLFKQIPGLKVIKPSNVYEAKGFLVWAIEEPNPVIFVDNRELYQTEVEISEKNYRCTPMYLTPPDPWCPAPCSEILEKRFYEKVEGSIY